MAEEADKGYKVIRKVKLSNMNKIDYLMMKKMCSTCNFFIDNRCSKQRIIRKCAEQGLKNRE